MNEDQEIRVKCLEQAIKIHIHNGSRVLDVLPEMFEYVKNGTLVPSTETVTKE